MIETNREETDRGAEKKIRAGDCRIVEEEEEEVRAVVVEEEVATASCTVRIWKLELFDWLKNGENRPLRPAT